MGGPGCARYGATAPLASQQTFVVSEAFRRHRPARSGGDDAGRITSGRAGGSAARPAELWRPARTDATGRVLHSWLQLQGGRALLDVDDANAVYPVTVDPYVQQAELTEAGTPPLTITLATRSGSPAARSLSEPPRLRPTRLPTLAQPSSSNMGRTAGSRRPRSPPRPSHKRTVRHIRGDLRQHDRGRSSWRPQPGLGGERVGNLVPLPSGNFLHLRGAGRHVEVRHTKTTELTHQPTRFATQSAFGQSVAIDGSTVVVGAPYWVPRRTGGYAEPGGAAFVYTLTSTGATTGPSDAHQCPCIDLLPVSIDSCVVRAFKISATRWPSRAAPSLSALQAWMTFCRAWRRVRLLRAWRPVGRPTKASP